MFGPMRVNQIEGMLLPLLFLGGRTTTFLSIDLLGSLAAPPVNNGLIYDPFFGYV